MFLRLVLLLAGRAAFAGEKIMQMRPSCVAERVCPLVGVAWGGYYQKKKRCERAGRGEAAWAGWPEEEGGRHL